MKNKPDSESDFTKGVRAGLEAALDVLQSLSVDCNHGNVNPFLVQEAVEAIDPEDIDL